MIFSDVGCWNSVSIWWAISFFLFCIILFSFSILFLAYFYSGIWLIWKYILPQSVTTAADKCSFSDIWFSRSVQEQGLEHPWDCWSMIFGHIWPPESIDWNSTLPWSSFFLLSHVLNVTSILLIKKKEGWKRIVTPFSYFIAIWCFSYRWCWLMMNVLFPPAPGSPHRREKSTDARGATGAVCLPILEKLQVAALCWAPRNWEWHKRLPCNSWCFLGACSGDAPDWLFVWVWGFFWFWGFFGLFLF